MTVPPVATTIAAVAPPGKAVPGATQGHRIAMAGAGHLEGLRVGVVTNDRQTTRHAGAAILTAGAGASKGILAGGHQKDTPDPLRATIQDLPLHGAGMTPMVGKETIRALQLVVDAVLGHHVVTPVIEESPRDALHIHRGPLHQSLYKYLGRPRTSPACDRIRQRSSGNITPAECPRRAVLGDASPARLKRETALYLRSTYLIVLPVPPIRPHMMTTTAHGPCHLPCRDIRLHFNKNLYVSVHLA